MCLRQWSSVSKTLLIQCTFCHEDLLSTLLFSCLLSLKFTMLGTLNTLLCTTVQNVTMLKFPFLSLLFV